MERKINVVFLNLFFIVAGLMILPSSSRTAEKKTAITTTIADAGPEVPFLDDYSPEAPFPMSLLPRTQNGRFILNRPGHFIFEAQSFCLNAGKYSPSDEIGYLYAPLKGPRAEMIRNLLRRSFNHPDIMQEDIQTLIWAMDTQAPIREMSPEMQHVAERLLNKKELRELNKGAVGKIARRIWERTRDRLPPRIQEILEARDRLRELFSQARASYEDLADIAVLDGEPPPGEGSRDVPVGRWAVYPQGYFIRTTPHGFSEMLIELYLPENFQIKHDERGRIISISDNEGNKIETDYEKMTSALRIPGEADLQVNVFRSIRFERFDLDDSGQKLNSFWQNSGWAFLGVPNREGSVRITEVRFPDLALRYKNAVAHKKAMARLLAKFRKKSEQNLSQNSTTLEIIMDLGHYAAALKSVLKNNVSDQESWEYSHIGLVKRAWMQAVYQYLRFTHYRQNKASTKKDINNYRFPTKTRKTYFSDIEKIMMPIFISIAAASDSGGYPTFDPVAGAAGGNTSAQTVAASGRGTEDNNNCTADYKGCVKDAKKEHFDCLVDCQSVDPDFEKEDERIAEEICFEACKVGLQYDLIKCRQDNAGCF